MTMTANLIKSVAPSVFSTTPSPSMSNRYTFVPTFEIIENFEREGWTVSSARQIGKSDFSKHEIRLRNGELLRHSNMDMGEIRRVTDEFAERLPIIQRSVSKMENTFLSEQQSLDLLNKAAFLRWQKNSIPVRINMEELLVAEREADMGNSVWQTFNVIQEKFVRGGTQYRTGRGRSMTMKSLKDFQVINKINTGLWELAESYC